MAWVQQNDSIELNTIFFRSPSVPLTHGMSSLWPFFKVMLFFGFLYYFYFGINHTVPFHALQRSSLPKGLKIAPMLKIKPSVGA